MGNKGFCPYDAHNGYVYRAQIYTGKNSVVQAREKIGLSSRVVLDLLKGMDYRVVYVYSTPNLFLTCIRRV